MKREIARSILYVILLCGLSGCGRVVDWAKDTFDQGKDLENELDSARSHVQSTTVYDQFTTIGIFDVLWLSDEVRTAMSNAYALRRGKPEEFKKTFLRRQLEENNHFIIFYVLSPYEYPLGESHSDWQLFLKINDAIYYPSSIKTVELDLEYKLIFGKRYTRFKESYVVKFDAKNVEDKKIITDQTEKIEIYFRTDSKEVALVWHPYGQRILQPLEFAQSEQNMQGNA